MDISRGHKNIAYTLVCSTILSVVLTSCAPQNINTADLQNTIKNDREVVYRHGDTVQALKLEDVLARALRYNLDTRVAEMDALVAADDRALQELNVLPTISGKAQRVGRNNPGGSSSFSLLTNTQSLQPSISSDQYRTTQLLSVDWNLLDAGINVFRSKSAGDQVLIVEERRRKVFHNVVQDTYSSYWRAAVAQSALPVIEKLLTETQDRLDKVDAAKAEGIIPLPRAEEEKGRLFSRRHELMTLKQGLILAETELKTLIDYPLNQPIVLDLGGKDWLANVQPPKLNGDVERFEEVAFLNRPEVREEYLNKKIALRNIKLSIIETFPGADIVLGMNRDSNSFLSYNTWLDHTIGLTATLNKLFTAPYRYDRAKKTDKLADRRRQALVAAVITQVHVAKKRFDYLTDVYDESLQSDQNAQDGLQRAEDYADVGMGSGATLLDAQIDASVSTINRSMAYADVQDSYGRFIGALGVDLWEADDAGLTIPEFAQRIRKKLDQGDIFMSVQAEEKVPG